MVQVVWFKRDLRIADHAPLAAAMAAGPVLPLYVVEPDLWRQPDMAGRHLAFVTEAIAALRASLSQIGLKLVIRVGEIADVLAAIHAQTPITALHSHQETGNFWTYARDRAVGRSCREANIAWREAPQFGVARATNDRNRWAARWEAFMGSPVVSLPSGASAVVDVASDPWPLASALGLADDPCPGRQRGGRSQALALLDSFLAGRGRNYQREMSSPLTAEHACSRLSPHLAIGSLSMREVVQRAYRARADMAAMPPHVRPMDLRAIDAFIARLHWHCHFIQKLEDEPEVEFRCFHPAFEDARPRDSEDSAIRLAAWADGATGWPFVDACMRSLVATGWINFRMRAMLVAVSSYHLWLDWRDTGRVLARRFADYEPGIHWSQMQMQSGTTAINTLRIYNPVKQGKDQDPDGRFVRRWVPELANVPDAFIHEPWTMPPSVQQMCGVLIGRDYPAPVVDHVVGARLARERISEIRRTAGFGAAQRQVLEKHGSRKGAGRGRKAFPEQDRMLKKPVAEDKQLKLDF